MRRGSLVSAITSIKSSLTSSAAKKDISRSHGHRRKSNYESKSSSSSSSYSSVDSHKKIDYSDISDSDYSSSQSRSISRRSRGTKSRSVSHSDRHSKSSKRHSARKSEKRRRHRHHHHHRTSHSSSRRDDARQMVELLSSMLPFYGTGDYNSDALIIDTIHRLPSHALEMADVNGQTLLILACQFAAYDLLPTLLSKGCDVNASNNIGVTPLHCTCFSESFSAESAMTLIRHGAIAEVVEHDYGCTPLHWAAFAGHTDLCRVLCIAGANPSTRDKGGNDPISYGRQSGNHACIELLESFRTNSNGAEESNLRWDRMIDGSTGSSFYYNKQTGESLWGDTFRNRILPTTTNGSSKPSESPASGVEVVTVNNAADGTVDIEEIAISPNENTSREAGTNELRYSTPDQQSRTSFQSPPLDDIEEVDSLESNTGEAPEDSTGNEEQKVAVNLISKLDKVQHDHNSSANSWDKDDVAHKTVEEAVQEQLAVKDSVTSSTKNADGPIKRVVQTKEEPEPSHAEGNRSFEERMNILHEKMEQQLISKLASLEEKITISQQQIHQQKIEASAEETMQLKKELHESTTTLMQLRTDIATKDLELLKLNKKVIHLETSLEESLTKPVTSCAGVGDGELNPDMLPVREEDFLAEKSKLEQEVNDALARIVFLEQQMTDTEQQLHVAERAVANEKACNASIMRILEEKSENSSSHLLNKLSEEQARSERAVNVIKEELARVQASSRNEIDSIRAEKESVEQRIADLEDQLTSAQASHKSLLVELQVQHDNDLINVKSSMMASHKQEIKTVQDQLREEKLARMEIELASNEAVEAKEKAEERAAAAELKLKQMTDMINETENLKCANEKLHTSLQAETEKRKILHNTIEDMKGRIRVYVRVRPLSEKEISAGYENVMTKEDDRTIVMAGDPATSTEVKDWEFDKIFLGTKADGNTQDAVFNDTSLLITSVIDGFNVCIFAYGQTGSGKTYTTFGGEEEEHKGLAPRIAFELFNKLQEKETSHTFDVSISMLELYTDKLNDLLVAKDANAVDLKIRLAEHTPSGLVEVDGAKVEQVTNAQELLTILNRGSKSRASSSTNMNADSSRSHMISTIVLTLTNKRTGNVVRGKLTLVDLAGSERVGKSGAVGQQLREAQSINLSLSSLGDVIGALTSGSRQHIPYRNHPLTMLMSDSIGGNAKTLMFVCCSPADWNHKESTNSLDFAKRCRNVTNVVSSNQSSANQIRMLRHELSKKKAAANIKRRSAGGIRRPGMT